MLVRDIVTMAEFIDILTASIDALYSPLTHSKMPSKLSH